MNTIQCSCLVVLSVDLGRFPFLFLLNISSQQCIQFILQNSGTLPYYGVMAASSLASNAMHLHSQFTLHKLFAFICFVFVELLLYLICTGGHFEPAPSLLKKYYIILFDTLPLCKFTLYIVSLLYMQTHCIIILFYYFFIHIVFCIFSVIYVVLLYIIHTLSIICCFNVVRSENEGQRSSDYALS